MKDIDLSTCEDIIGDDKTINVSLFNILNTSICTMPGFPEFGFSTGIVFGQNDDLSVKLLKEDLGSTVELFDSRIIITNSDAEKYENYLNVSFDIEIKGSGEYKTAINITTR